MDKKRNPDHAGLKVVSLCKARGQLNNGDAKQIEDLVRLELIYSEIQQLNNPDAKRVATLACRAAQTYVTKAVLD